MEKMHRAEYGEEGAALPCSPGAPLSQPLHLKLSEPSSHPEAIKGPQELPHYNKRRSFHPYPSGNSKGFRSSVLAMRIKPSIFLIIPQGTHVFNNLQYTNK